MKPNAESDARRERDLFLSALEIEDPSERAAFLDRECAGDVPLRASVDALLSNHVQDAFLESGAGIDPWVGKARQRANADRDQGEYPLEGEWIGAFRILSRLGEGHGGQTLTATLLAVGGAAAAAAVWHARRSAKPMLDLRAMAVPTFRVSVASAGMLSRLAISASPFLLPLMFQTAFGMDALQAGSMVLVYMLGNLAMKSVTTPILKRFGFRRVLVANGALCTACLLACAFLAPGQAVVAVGTLLLATGMTRSMNFTAINTLAFADVPDSQRAGASALLTMLTLVSMALGVALAASALGLSQSLRGAPALALADFRHAWLLMAAVMAVATAINLRLDRDAGGAVASR